MGGPQREGIGPSARGDADPGAVVQATHHSKQIARQTRQAQRFPNMDRRLVDLTRPQRDVGGVEAEIGLSGNITGPPGGPEALVARPARRIQIAGVETCDRQYQGRAARQPVGYARPVDQRGVPA